MCALYFAVENESKYNIDGALFACLPEKLDVGSDVHDIKFNAGEPLKVNKDLWVMPPMISQRHIAQHGLFQCVKDPACEILGLTRLMKFKIPKEYKQSIKHQLFISGSTDKVYFPGMERLCKTINYMYLRNYNR